MWRTRGLTSPPARRAIPGPLGNRSRESVSKGLTCPIGPSMPMNERLLPAVQLIVALCLGAACAAPNPRLPSAPHPRESVVAEDSHSTAPSGAVNTGTLHPESTGPRTLDLSAAIALALAENPDMRAAAARVDAARAGLREARAAFLPAVGVDISYLRADAPSMYLFKSIDSGRFQAGTDFNAPGAFNSWEAGIGVSYNIYDGGRDDLRRAIADDGVESEHLRSTLVENALVAAVIDTWFEVRSATDQIATAHASVETVEAQLREARARHEEGRALESDVLSLDVRRAEALELEIRARNAHDLALASMAQLMGLRVDESLRLEGPGNVPGSSPADWPEALARALAERADLALARAEMRATERQVGISESANLPRADLFARGWRDAPEADFDQSRDNWALGVSLSWSLFDGARGPASARARARLEERRQAVRRTELAVELDVKSAWLRLESALSRSTVTLTAVTAAEESLRQVKAQFEAGAAPVTRYLEAELMNTQSRMRHTHALFDLERGRANLARAVGEFGPDSEGATKR